jgi:hypothetical protein
MGIDCNKVQTEENGTEIDENGSGEKPTETLRLLQKLTCVKKEIGFGSGK